LIWQPQLEMIENTLKALNCLGRWLIKQSGSRDRDGITLSDNGDLELDLDKLIKPNMKPIFVSMPFGRVHITELGAIVRYDDGRVWCHWRDGLFERIV
jgi:hypothetical protein